VLIKNINLKLNVMSFVLLRSGRRKRLLKRTWYQFKGSEFINFRKRPDIDEGETSADSGCFVVLWTAVCAMIDTLSMCYIVGHTVYILFDWSLQFYPVKWALIVTAAEMSICVHYDLMSCEICVSFIMPCVLLIEGGKQFPCSQCEKSYIGAKNLARHYRLTGHGV